MYFSKYLLHVFENVTMTRSIFPRAG